MHELGHVAGAWLSGGTIVSLELRPGRLAHTLVRPNPHPSLVLWGGFLAGWLVPLATAPAWRVRRGAIGPVMRVWAAFCLLAGGSYLAIGGGERLTDTGRLVALGWPLAGLIAVGVGVAVLGYWRSRAAWIELVDAMRRGRVGPRVAAAWWLWLAAWWGGQHALAIWSEP